MLAIAEARKREKMETEAAKKRVLDEIARDRAERAERAAGGGAKPAEKPAAPAPAQQQASAPKNYDETTIQFRLLDGSIVKQKFGAKETVGCLFIYFALVLDANVIRRSNLNKFSFI